MGKDQSRADVQASELFCQRILQDAFVETQVNQQLLQLPVLVLELLQPPQLVCLKAAMSFLQR